MGESGNAAQWLRITGLSDAGHRRYVRFRSISSARLNGGEAGFGLPAARAALDGMTDIDSQRPWFWATLVLSSISIVAIVFAFWELVENHFFTDLNYVSLHYLYISRGIASSLLLAVWAAWYVLRSRRASEEELRRSRERYRGLLDASPGAVALYDDSLCVIEWNSSAEKLYGYSKAEVIGRALPTVPPERELELASYLHTVSAGEKVIDDESVRMSRDGEHIAVRLNLLPYDEVGARYFLEVTGDIREQVRLRQTLIEIEKLTSMGMMAAGTAHHLNTPLASMLLRTQMLRERAKHSEFADDLAQLEMSMGFCQQFVRRLLDFSRRPTTLKRPQEVKSAIDAVMGFMSPTMLTKRVQVHLALDEAAGQYVLCDQNQLETVLLILLSNALDAVAVNGEIEIECVCVPPGRVTIRVSDNGCGIEPAQLSQVFEPFFTTKITGKGTGLGLPIARNIVHEHGGTITLQSEPGKGTDAIIELPVCSRPQAAHVEAAQ